MNSSDGSNSNSTKNISSSSSSSSSSTTTLVTTVTKTSAETILSTSTKTTTTTATTSIIKNNKILNIGRIGGSINSNSIGFGNASVLKKNENSMNSPVSSSETPPSPSTSSLPPATNIDLINSNLSASLSINSSTSCVMIKQHQQQQTQQQQQQQQQQQHQQLPPSPSSPAPTTVPAEKIGVFERLKSQKGRRKISLPWFRQHSVSAPHAALSRQHTIDSPGSFRFLRQSSSTQQQVV